MKATFLPLGRTVEVLPDESVLQAAIRCGVLIRTVCNGRATCAACRVRVVEGMSNTVKPGFVEKNLIGNTWFITKERLACQLLLRGDVIIDLSENQQG
ncbi:MAG: hypothetical protein AMXMBFR64_36400 [Myxococcales bacterium]